MGDTDPKRKRTRADDLRFEGSDDDLELPMPDEPYEESYARRQMKAVAKQARVFDPTGDTDPLADVIAASLRGDDDDACSWYDAEGAQAAVTIRARLADGSLPLRSVLPPEVADVLDAAVAFHDDLAQRLSGAREGTPLAHFLAAVKALPEHTHEERGRLMAAPTDGPVELVDAISWAAHTAFNLDRPPSSAEARHFLRHLASNGHTTTPTPKDTP